MSRSAGRATGRNWSPTTGRGCASSSKPLPASGSRRWRRSGRRTKERTQKRGRRRTKPGGVRIVGPRRRASRSGGRSQIWSRRVSQRRRAGYGAVGRVPGPALSRSLHPLGICDCKCRATLDGIMQRSLPEGLLADAAWFTRMGYSSSLRSRYLAQAAGCNRSHEACSAARCTDPALIARRLRSAGNTSSSPCRWCWSAPSCPVGGPHWN